MARLKSHVLHAIGAGYDAFTIKAIMGHQEMKTTERYIRANRLTQQVPVLRNWTQIGHTRNTAASAGGRKLLI